MSSFYLVAAIVVLAIHSCVATLLALVLPASSTANWSMTDAKRRTLIGAFAVCIGLFFSLYSFPKFAEWIGPETASTPAQVGGVIGATLGDVRQFCSWLGWYFIVAGSKRIRVLKTTKVKAISA